MSELLDRKKSFLIYHDYLQHFEMLSIEERGILITDLLKYAISGELPDYAEDQFINRALAMAFSIMSRQIDRDNSRYEEKCNKNKKSADKRWSGNKEKASQDLYDIARRNCGHYENIEEDGNGGLIIKSRDGVEVGIVTPDGQYKYSFGAGMIRHQ